MNRLKRIAGFGLVASVAAAGVAIGGAASASAATVRPALTASSCTVAAHNYAFPRVATTYKAGAAGWVTVAPVNRGTIKVTRVVNATGYTHIVDTWSGSSVDVYFHSRLHNVKFEAEINDWGGLTVTVTTC